MSMDFDPDHIARSPFTVGALGSLVSLRFAPGLTWIERAGNVLAGASCAGILSPAAAEWMRIGSTGMQSAMAFITGLFGLSLCAAVIDGVRALKVGEIITGWVSRKG